MNNLDYLTAHQGIDILGKTGLTIGPNLFLITQSHIRVQVSMRQGAGDELIGNVDIWASPVYGSAH